MLLWCCSSQTPPGALPGWWWRAQYWWVSAPQTWQQEVLGASWGSEPHNRVQTPRTGLRAPTTRFRPHGLDLSSPDQGSDPQHEALPCRTGFSHQNTARATFGGSETHPCPVRHRTAIRTIPSHIPHTNPEGYSEQ